MGRPFKRMMGYLLFICTVMIMSWESSLASAAILQPTIPDEAIRIRILANSNSVEDQWVKREIRDVIMDEMNAWDSAIGGIDEARAQLRSRLPAIERMVNEQLIQYGFAYRANIVLGRVDFPTKVFGKEVYPAGEYEALRITLGQGQGDNW